MTYVVTEACIKCKHTDCVAECPVDCFLEGKHFLVIDPVACIDCNLCVLVCPLNAIYPEAAVPVDMKDYIEINAKLAKSPDFSPITQKMEPMHEHAYWAQVKDKRHLVA